MLYYIYIKKEAHYERERLINYVSIITSFAAKSARTVHKQRAESRPGSSSEVSHGLKILGLVLD